MREYGHQMATTFEDLSNMSMREDLVTSSHFQDNESVAGSSDSDNRSDWEIELDNYLAELDQVAKN